MMIRTLVLVALALASVPARADLSDAGNLLIGGNGIAQGTMTVQGAAFSVGGSTLSVANGAVSSSGQPGAKARLINDQAVASSVYTTLYFGDEACGGCYDRQDTHSTTSSSQTFTTKASGIYFITCSVVWEANATGIRSVVVADDAANTTIYASSVMTAGSANTLVMSATSITNVGANQPMQCNVRQDSGANVNVFGSLSSYMLIQKLW